MVPHAFPRFLCTRVSCLVSSLQYKISTSVGCYMPQPILKSIEFLYFLEMQIFITNYLQYKIKPVK